MKRGLRVKKLRTRWKVGAMVLWLVVVASAAWAMPPSLVNDDYLFLCPAFDLHCVMWWIAFMLY